MARTKIRIQYTDPQIANQKAGNILSLNGYKLINENGENVWTCGMGLLAAVKYVKIEFNNDNTLTLSGWIKTTVPAEEQDLNGFVGAIPKKQVKNILKEIQSAIK